MKKFISLIISLIFLLSVASFGANAYKPAYKLHSKATFLYNIDTDTVVFSQNPDEKMYPASLTKIMVALLYCEKFDNLKDKTFTVSKKVAEEYQYSEAVTGGFEEGDKINGYDLLAYTMVKSCADASAVIAEEVSGSEPEFIDLMNKRAKELGLNNTHFTNCHGLHDPNHYSTARDLCTLTRAAMNISVIKDIVTVPRYETKNGITLAASNLLVDPSSGYYYKYATGFKTGYTDEAGRCLASTATYEGMTYISILLGCPAVENSLINRYEFLDTAELFRWVFTSFTYRSVLSPNETVDSVPVSYSWDSDTVNIRPKDEVFALVPIGANKSTFKIKTEYKVKNLEAPVKKGDILGTVKVNYAGNVIGTCDAIAAESVEGSQVLKLLTIIKDFIKKNSIIFVPLALGILIAIIILIAITVRLNSKKSKYGKVKRYKRY